MRQGLTEVGFTEVMAVAEHVGGLCCLATLLGIAPDLAQAPPEERAASVPLVPESAGEGSVRRCFAAIRAWSRDHLGIDRVPNIWRAMAHQPAYLEATWDKDRLVLAPGQLDQTTKLAVAMGVAANRGSSYFCEYYRTAFHHLGLDAKALVEAAALSAHFVSYNTIAHSMQLEGIPLPADLLPHLRREEGALSRA